MSFLTHHLDPSAAPLARQLTQSILLEESKAPELVRATILIIGALLTVFLIWAAVTDMEEIASASGQVIPSGYVQAVQNPESGIVREIFVHEGDLVEAGQPLLKLDDTSASSDLEQMRVREEALKLQAARLKSFANQTKEATSSAIVPDESSDMAAGEAAILKSMEEARATQQQVLQNQIAQKQNELKALRSTRLALQKNAALMQQENTIRQDLSQKGYGSVLNALNSERNLNEVQGKLQETISQESRANEAIREAQNRLQSLDAELRQDALKNLGQVEAELAEVQKGLRKLEAVADRTLLKAPNRGIVKGLSVHTIGAVVESGKVLMEIVPMDGNMRVEALILPQHVGHLTPGQPVKIKVSSYDFSRYGSVAGELEHISASTFQNQDGQVYYKGRVKLAQGYVGDDPAHNYILPGMTVQADIITGEKSMLQYLLRPLHTAASQAFSER